MPAKKTSKSTSSKGTTKTTASAPRGKARAAEADVDGFMGALDHPLKSNIQAVRAIVLGVDPSIGEGVKWNSVSFRAGEYFATVNLRSRDAVQLVFHRGATSKDNTRAMEVPDPAGLAAWLSSDRCLVTLGAGPEVRKRRAAFERFVRAWVEQM